MILLLLLFHSLFFTFFINLCWVRTLQVKAAPDLIFYYTFDEGTVIRSSVLDSSGGNRIGILQGSGYSYISEFPTAFGTGSIFHFNNYIRLPYFSTLSNQEFTVTFFMKTASTGWAKVFDFGNGPDRDNIGYSPQLGALMSNTSELFQPFGLNDNKWHFIAWKVTSTDSFGNWKIFVDKGIVYDKNRTRPNAVTRKLNMIGWGNLASDPMYIGYLDDFRFYDGPLADDEIQNIYQSSRLSVSQNDNGNDDDREDGDNGTGGGGVGSGSNSSYPSSDYISFLSVMLAWLFLLALQRLIKDPEFRRSCSQSCLEFLHFCWNSARSLGSYCWTLTTRSDGSNLMSTSASQQGVQMETLNYSYLPVAQSADIIPSAPPLPVEEMNEVGPDVEIFESNNRAIVVRYV